MTAYSGRRRGMVSVLAFAATVASSHAALTITEAPDFQVSITAGETVSVGCAAGNVAVVVDGVPTMTGGTALATQQTNTVTWNGSLAAGASITVTIRAALKLGLAAGRTVSNQATVAFDADGDGSNESSRLSDDPALPGSSDPTTFTVSLPGNR